MNEDVKSCGCCSDDMGCGHNRTSHHNEKTIKELSNRMNRIEGQVRGIKGMMNDMSIATIFSIKLPLYNLH